MKTSLTLQKQVLERIKAQGVKPMPKGYFKAREYLLWGLLGVLVAALAVGFGMIVFMVKGADMTLFAKLGLTATEKILYTIPFFWISATIIVATIAYVNFRTTRLGYRISIRQFILIAALVATGLGSVAYASHFSEFIDNIASENVPLYNAVIPLNTNTWFDPEKGLLSGTVRSKENDNDFTLRDPDSVLWHVTGNIVKPEGFTFGTGDTIRLIGTAKDNDEFRAIEVVNWKPN
ncbi:MAG TPA: hypothetical protein VGE35_03990 [Candidatus Paceibacterota bacterium]